MAKGEWGLPQWLERGVADLFPTGTEASDADQQLAARLAEAEKAGRPLRIKLGIDPTGSDIHLGHSILFRKLRAFQDAGHTAVLIIGDFPPASVTPRAKVPPAFSSRPRRSRPTPAPISSSSARARTPRVPCWISRPRAAWRCAATANGWPPSIYPR